MRIRFFLGLLLLLASCTGRNPVAILPTAAALGHVQTIFVATRRRPDPAAIYGPYRNAKMNYLQVGVSVPPKRRPGEIRSGRIHPDPTRDFVVTGYQGFADRSIFQHRLGRNLSRRSATDREVIVFVHGYNNSFADGIFRAAQLVEDFSLPGQMVHYSWPSAGHPLGYAYDRDSVLFARDGLEQLLHDVRAAGATRILLVGHSLGAMLIMETLRQIEIGTPGWARKNLNGVVLISPDIDLDLFQAQANRIKTFPQPIMIFTSRNDRVLKLSQRLNGSSARLGSVTDPAKLANLPVLLFDVSRFAIGPGTRHFTPGTSPALIKLLSHSIDLGETFSADRAGKTGLLPGTVIRVKKATQLILSPAVQD